jgi:nucleotide-binding universal stress UspA family protein
METILVPLDGSALAEQVLPQVRLLASLLEARVHLLRGITMGESTLLSAKARSPAPAPAVCAQCAQTALCGHTDCYIAAQASALRAAGVDADADMRVGAPAAVISTAAAQSQDTLVAMVTHGHRGLRRWVRGSVADEIVHNTTAPLLLVRGSARESQAAPRLKRILVPLDGSALARQALPLAIELVARARAELILLWVVAPSIDAYLRIFPAEADARGALRDQVAEALATYADQRLTPPEQITSAVGVGPPAQAIAEEASRRHVDLIVMATHGYIGLRRWRLGSVADQVLHATTTPLLLVRSQAAGSEMRSV